MNYQDIQSTWDSAVIFTAIACGLTAVLALFFLGEFIERKRFHELVWLFALLCGLGAVACILIAVITFGTKIPPAICSDNGIQNNGNTYNFCTYLFGSETTSILGASETTTWTSPGWIVAIVGGFFVAVASLIAMCSKS